MIPFFVMAAPLWLSAHAHVAAPPLTLIRALMRFLSAPRRFLANSNDDSVGLRNERPLCLNGTGSLQV